jgi:hypothetical protein
VTPGAPGAPGAGADLTRARRAGRTGLAAIAVSIAATVAVGAAGPSLMEPPLPGAPGAPGWLPWSADLGLSPYLAVGLAAASLAAGALGLALTLRAMRSGWTVTPRYVLLAGVLAALVAGTTRPFGTSDFLSYAAYGRELVTGHNPYLVAPLALPGDPVARAVQDWAGTPSVYGALATGVFGAASVIGGASARLTVFILDLVNTAAFVVAGALLYRLARGRAGRLRAAVLWTCNPLLLQVLVAGSHVDGLAIAFSIGGLAILSPLIPNARCRLSSPDALRGVMAGTLLGMGFAVKPTMLLAAAGLVIGVRRQRRVVAGLALAFGVVAMADLLLIGRAGVAQTVRASGLVSAGSPWRVVRTVLSQFMSEGAASGMVRWCAVTLAVLLAVGLLRTRVYGPRTGLLPGPRDTYPAVGCAFALVLAWLMAWPYLLPWYDALAWALLSLLPASGIDWLLVARTTVLAFGYLPARATGITIPGGLGWMEPVLRSVVTPAVLAGLIVVLAWRMPRSAGGAARPAPVTGSNYASHV